MNDESRREPEAVPLIRGRFLRRYKRFFADVELEDGTVVTAHCPNTGSMKTLLSEGADAYLRPAANPKRKLAWTLERLGLPGGGHALIDTAKPNGLVAAAVARGDIPVLAGYDLVERERPYGLRPSRIDLLLSGGPTGAARGPAWVEIKNVTMASATVPRRADFPDAVTSRGLAHLEELRILARDGRRAVMFFLVSRDDCDRFGVAEEIDPAYAEALRSVQDGGVELIAHRLDFAADGMRVGASVPIEIR